MAWKRSGVRVSSGPPKLNLRGCIAQSVRVPRSHRGGLWFESRYTHMKTKKYYVYFLQSLIDGSYYVGVSDNVQRRFKQHSDGESKSTSSKRPWIIKRMEEYLDINSAYKRERFLKRMKSRKIIEKIINSEK